MQCESESESRFLHDQLLVLGPLLQALSASTPIFKGQLASTDTRWEVISQAVDDRTHAERKKVQKNEQKTENSDNHQQPQNSTFSTEKVAKKTSKVEISTLATSKNSIFDILQAGLEPPIMSKSLPAEKVEKVEMDVDMAGYGIKPLSRSRYSLSCLYLHQPQSLTDLNKVLMLNDLPVEHDESVFLELIKTGTIDVPLALHLSHMFTRDPLVIFDDAITLDNSKSLDHFESIQSTNWRSMRWKPPSLRVGLEADNRRRHKTQQIINDFGSKNEGNLVENGGKSEGEVEGNLRENAQKFEENAARIESGDDDRSMNDYLLDFDHNILVEDRVDFAYDGFPSTQVSQPNKQQLQVKEEEDLQVFGPGWRIEFRPLEVQLTDFENAAFAVFVILISRAMVAYGRQGDTSMLIPMTLVEENMRRAQKKDAVLNEKFYVRRNAFPSFTATATSSSSDSSADCVTCGDKSSSSKGQFTIPDVHDLDIVELSLDHIINGEPPTTSSANRFPGLMPIAIEYMKSLGCDDTSMVSNGLAPYLKLLQHRANGSLPTTARYIRDYVKSHPEYVKQQSQQSMLHNPQEHAKHTHDTAASTTASIANMPEIISDLTPAINDDLLLHCEDIGMGRIHTPALYGNFKPIENLDNIDEEDLMFSNFTCFVKPVKTPFLDLAEMSMLEGVEEEVVSQPKGLVGVVKEMFMKPWRRVSRSKEEQIKL